MSNILKKTPKKTPLYQWLDEKGLLEYGSIILVEDIQEFLEIKLAHKCTVEEFKDASLKEMAAIDNVRNILVNEGKYITMDRTAYRILLPSENLAQVDRYIGAAERKLRRARKLARSTAGKVKIVRQDQQARVEAKLRGLVSMKQAGDMLA